MARTPTRGAKQRRLGLVAVASGAPDYASQTLKAVTNWARYAEAFAYDEGADRFTLDDPN